MQHHFCCTQESKVLRITTARFSYYISGNENGISIPACFQNHQGNPITKDGLPPLNCPTAQRSQTFKEAEVAALPFILDGMISLYCVASWKYKGFYFYY